MRGRMRPYLPELTIRDYNTYQWYLRGVRRQLYTTYGIYPCYYGLRYNGVLFALLADSLAGRPATCKRMRVPGTLLWQNMMCQTQGIRLAAQHSGCPVGGPSGRQKGAPDGGHRAAAQSL